MGTVPFEPTAPEKAYPTANLALLADPLLTLPRTLALLSPHLLLALRVLTLQEGVLAVLHEGHHGVISHELRQAVRQHRRGVDPTDLVAGVRGHL
eukprot:8446164-Alexandrium_andersonii.AAC.1